MSDGWAAASLASVYDVPIGRSFRLAGLAPASKELEQVMPDGSQPLAAYHTTLDRQGVKRVEES